MLIVRLSKALTVLPAVFLVHNLANLREEFSQS